MSDNNANYRSYANYYSDANYCSYGLHNCKGTANGIFLKDQQSSPKIFNKEVSFKRYQEVISEIKRLNDGWYPEFTTIKQLYLKHGSDWKATPVKDAEEISWFDAWKSMPKATINYLKSIPEFDAELFKEITGIDVNMDICAGKMVEIDGKRYRLQEVTDE